MLSPRWAALAAVLSTCAFAQAKSDSKSPRPEPTRAQTEDWLREHVEAWNQGDVHVTVKDCRVLVQDGDRQRSEILDLRGLLLPVEVIRTTPKDATVRLRVKQKHSGTYAMFRACDASNHFCADATGKFQAMPWMDLTVTWVDDFIPGRQTTVDKTQRLERALQHYSNLCGAMEDARNLLF